MKCGTCLTCAWAKAIESDDYDKCDDVYDLECHRMPPQLAPSYDGYVSVYFPAVSGFDWCGEYRKAE